MDLRCVCRGQSGKAAVLLGSVLMGVGERGKCFIASPIMKSPVFVLKGSNVFVINDVLE